MRLSADQIRQAILHPDWDVRDMALAYFQDSFVLDPSVIGALIEAVGKYGWADACSPYNLYRPLPQTEDSVRWILEQLQQPCPDLERERLWTCWTRFLSWQLNGAAVELLLPFEKVLTDLPGLDPECLENTQNRLATGFMDPETAWRELECYCEQNAGDFEPIEFADDDLQRFADMILRGGGRFSERVLTLLAESSDDLYDDDPRYWMHAAATLLAGHLRLAAAIPRLIDRLEVDVDDDGQWYCQKCADALVRIGTDDVLRAVADRFPAASWDFRSVTSRIFESIHSAFAVASGLQLLAGEADDSLRAFLADSLLVQFDSDTIEPVRHLILRGQCDELEEQLIRRLVAVSTLLNMPVSEIEPWRERAREAAAIDRQEQEARLTEDGRLPDDWDNEIDEFQNVYGILDDLGDDFADDDFDDDDGGLEGDAEDAEEDFDESEDDPDEVVRPIFRGDPKVGRNDPCPCGSGKKFKQCCLNRQKNPPKIDW